MGVKLVFVDKVAFKRTSGVVLTGAQRTAVVMGVFAEQDVELKVTAI